MSRLYMMIGLPGSGKSYQASKMDDVAVVSSDSIREELFGDVNDQEHNNEVFNEVNKRIYNYLKDGVDTVYDATNLSRKRRRNFLKTLPKECTTKIAMLMATEYDICLENNNKRDRHVPEDVIERMYKHITIPNEEEGFDKIVYIRHEDNKKSMLDYFIPCINFDQNNPNHTLTLSDHMEATYAKVYELASLSDLSVDEKEILYKAAMFHDIGKPVCKTYEKYNGQIDDHAHYYNHAEVGAYMSICAREPMPIFAPHRKVVENYKRNTISFLIQNHMRFFDENFSLEKFASVYGERVAKMLSILHEADIEAH